MPGNKRLTAMVEGNRDETFIKEIVRPILLEKHSYKDIITYKYANRTKTENIKFVDAVKSLNDDVLCLGDIKGAPCVTEKKKRLQMEKVGEIGDDCIIVVIKEIESWYLAGVGRKCCRRLNIKFCDRTDRLSKEEFHAIIAKSKYQPRIHCIAEMIRNYDVCLAVGRNKSFNYFALESNYRFKFSS